MAKITFETSEAPARILSPLKAFAEDFHRIEVRKDPLLGHRSIYNPSLKEKVKFFFGECDQKLIEEMVAATARTCPFCPERLDASTPRYPSDFIPEGRMRLGEAVLFPNLYPLGKYHTVIRLTETHFLRLSQFTPTVLETGFQLARHHGARRRSTEVVPSVIFRIAVMSTALRASGLTGTGTRPNPCRC